MENLQQLFESTVKDLYSAETQYLKASPKLMKAARDSQLKATIETSLTQLEEHIARLERVGALGGFDVTGKTCKVAQGQIEETYNLLGRCIPGSTMDAAIISCLQKVEHYEMCSYGTLLAWAEVLGNKKVTGLLRQSLIEGGQNDQLLSAISEDVNASAAACVFQRGMAAAKEMVDATS